MLFSTRPLTANGAETLNSPVDGWYRYLALDVYTVVGVPVVAAANSGYSVEAVVVSLLIAAPSAMDCQVAAVPLVARNTCPVVGADELDTLTTVVAELSALALAAVPVVSWFSVGTSAACIAAINTLVPLPRK